MGKSVMWDDQIEDCELGFFQGASCSGDLRDSKSMSGGSLCVFGSHTVVPTSWMSWEQTAVSHSSAESELVSLDGFAEVCLQRVTGLTSSSCMWSPAVESWHVPVFLLQSSSAGRGLLNGSVSRVRPRSLERECVESQAAVGRRRDTPRGLEGQVALT